MRGVWLIGGGRDAALLRACHEPFVAACGGRVACFALDDPERWVAALRAAGASDVRVVVISAERPPRGEDLEGAEGVYVAGGLTPLYAELLRDLSLPPETPYAGFSAGAAVASARAIVGGWLLDGCAVCPSDAAEDLDDVTVVPGLGLVPFAVDVHAAQWGTLGRAVGAVRAGFVPEAWAIDEHTALEVRGDAVSVLGAGNAYRVTRGDADIGSSTPNIRITLARGGAVSP